MRESCFLLFPFKPANTSTSAYVPPVANSRHNNFLATRPPLPTIQSELGSGQVTPRVNLPSSPSEVKVEGGVSLDGDDKKARPASVHSAKSGESNTDGKQE